MIRVRPNLHTLAIGSIAVTMWYAGAAQQNGGAYILAFLTAAIAAVSMLQARANLRGVQITSGIIPPTEAGRPVRLPLTLSVGNGREPCGLEITGEGIASPVFIEKVSLQQPTRIELNLTTRESGHHDDLTVIVRSFYPLGVFTAQRAIKLAQSRLVLPKPEGTLPLPAAQDAKSGDQPAATKPGKIGEGDDFAGVREWQAGDPLRHVDWKAVARGRPMMVKLWSGNPSKLVWLEWNQLDLPAGQRVKQLAQWVEQAEAEGLEYGLRLPDVEVQPAAGAEHRRRCLEALARQGDGSTKAATLSDETIAPRIATCETRSTLPGNPMRLMLIALALTVLPMISALPVSGTVIFYASLLFRWWSLRKQKLGTPLVARLLLIGLGVALTYVQTRTLMGLESGVAIMLIVTAGKVLETRTPRDLQVLAVLGWFLCLCGLAIEQSIGHSLWAYVSFFLITVAVVRLRRGNPGIALPMRVTTTLLAQALPFVVLLFFLFPRGASNMVVRVSRSLTNRTGMADNLDPGTIASIARSNEIAFRVSLEGKSFRELPPPLRYWRCGVLWKCEDGDGFRWRPALNSDMPQGTPDLKAGFLQHIQLLPHGGKWLPALDSPTVDRRGNHEHYLSKDDNTMRSTTTVNSLRSYDVISHLETEYREPRALYLSLALVLPSQLSPRVAELAQTLRGGHQDARHIVQAALDYFRENGFQYSLEPGKYDDRTGLEDFLFKRRVGFCEHYAAAFCTLMRAAGVPARVVIGYQGGEVVNGAGYLIVRQSDAHAWAEVFISGKGWQRTDPTAALAPQRLTESLQTTLADGAEAAFAFGRNSWLGAAFQEVELAWDQVNYFWYDRVVQFDELKQQDLWSKLGLFQMSATELGIGGLVLFGLPLAALSWWFRRRALHPDPAVRLWMKFCDDLAKAGIKREPFEGPLAFARRAGETMPGKASQIARAADLYARYRYGTGPSLDELKAALGARLT